MDLRKRALDLFAVGIRAADPALALRRHLEASPLPLLTGGRYLLIAVGKAAVAMMAEALTHVPAGTQVSALAVTNYENARDLPGCEVFAAGHPVPDENGARAAWAVIGALERAGAADRVLALISGGGSALLPAPVEGVDLADKAEVSRILLGAGFDITEMNMVRQQLSRLKGGGMARLAAPARLDAYILSDVIGDDLRVIASGPTVAPIGTAGDVLTLLKSREVWEPMPQAAKAYLETKAKRGPGPAPEPFATGAENQRPATAGVTNTLICSNRQSLEAMRDAAIGWEARIISDRLIGNVTEAVGELLAAARRATPGSVLIFGGETTVTLTGKGTGGRNQDLALRFALGAADLPGDWVFLSGGTDGRDGPTDAAGGIVDPGSLSRMRAAGIDPAARLADNDSHPALEASADLIRTGGTGTNVADLQLFLRRASVSD